jgi:hypothetical protein
VVESKSRASFTTVKRDGIWKIAHFQNTVIDPKAENVDETKFDATGFPPPGDQTLYSLPGHQPRSAR